MVVECEELQRIKEYVLQQYPKEACGVLVAGEFIPCDNKAENPLTDFRILGSDILDISMNRGRVEAIIHSHPFDRTRPPKWDASWPSHNDMVQWISGSLPWGIVATEGENISPILWLDEGTIAPLEGRPFLHGVWDCYAVVRDWYRLEMGIPVMNFPRSMNWWGRGYDLYSQNFEKAGFVEIDRSEVQVGDSCLMQIMSPVPNHAAVISGNNRILHHLTHRLSGFDRLDKWDRHIVKFVRLVK